MNFISKILSNPTVFKLLKKWSMKSPYLHITNGEDVYMYRYWLFNPYFGNYHKWIGWLPSIRLHRIMRPDADRHLHDHPWNARTFILDGWYIEEREDGNKYIRVKGSTTSLKFNEFHRIDKVSDGGVWTLFITWEYKGTWGFKVDGKKIPYKTYLGIKE